MAKKRFQAEQIIGKLREAEVEISKGQSIGQVAKKLGITEQTYYRWRKEYGGLRTDQAKRLKEQEKQIARLKKRKLKLKDQISHIEDYLIPDIIA